MADSRRSFLKKAGAGIAAFTSDGVTVWARKRSRSSKPFSVYCSKLSENAW